MLEVRPLALDHRDPGFIRGPTLTIRVKFIGKDT